MELIAFGHHILLTKEKALSEKAGFTVPDNAKKKPARGIILSVGGTVDDKEIKPGMAGYFIPGSGHTLEVDDIEYIVLNDQQLVLGRWEK